MMVNNHIIMKKHIITIAVLGLTPYLADAQLDGSNASSLVKSITSAFNTKLIPLMITLALIYIIYAVVEYIRANDIPYPNQSYD